ncbi:MAG: hypothetical protein IIA89_14240 [Chloroflexi bacterium]|nr:hypothetical protein [Chloroflexota bacterium]
MLIDSLFATILGFVHTGAFLPTSIWAVVVLALFARTGRKRFKLLAALLPRTIIIVFAIYLFFLLSGILIQRGKTTPFLLWIGLFVMLLGVLLSYESRLYRPHTRKGLFSRALSNVYEAMGSEPDVVLPTILGDLHQIVGFVLLASPLTFLPLAIIGSAILIRSISADRKIQASLSSKGVTPVEELSMVLPSSSVFLSHLAVALIPALLVLVVTGNFDLFTGSPDDAIALLSLLIQIEAVAATFSVAILVLAMELTSSTYSPRLTAMTLSRASFRWMVFVASLSLAAKLLAVANPRSPFIMNQYLTESLLLLTVASTLSFVSFGTDAIKMLVPESIVQEVLKLMDQKWARSLRQFWSRSATYRRQDINRDPLSLIERILATLLKNQDLNSYELVLDQLHGRLESLHIDNSGTILDRYVSDRLQSVINIAAQNGLDNALEYLSESLYRPTTPTELELANQTKTQFDAPPGTILYRSILKVTVPNKLQEATISALRVIGRRAESAFGQLPEYSQLYWITDKPQKADTPENEKEQLRRNDDMLDVYMDGFIRYFSTIAIRSIELRFAPAAWMGASYLLDHLRRSAEEIKDEPYQNYLLNLGFIELKNILRADIQSHREYGISYFVTFFRSSAITNPRIADLIAHHHSDILIRLARAAKMDYSAIKDFAISGTDLAHVSPAAGLAMLEAMAQAAKSFSEAVGPADRDSYRLVMNEMHSRVDNIESLSLQYGYKTKVRKAAALVRRLSSH